jgi:hypothetical protein
MSIEEVFHIAKAIALKATALKSIENERIMMFASRC